MKRRLVPLLGIAFVAEAQSRQTIVVAARKLERGTVLKPSDLKMSPWAGPEAPKGAFTGAGQVAGLTVLESIQEDEPVIPARLAS
jgi:Flp pilus assembly protein CpaB